MKKFILIAIALVLVFSVAVVAEKDQGSRIGIVKEGDFEGIGAGQYAKAGDIIYISENDDDGFYIVLMNPYEAFLPDANLGYLPKEALILDPTPEEFKANTKFINLPEEVKGFKEVDGKFVESDEVLKGIFLVEEEKENMLKVEMAGGADSLWIKDDKINYEFSDFVKFAKDQDPKAYIEEAEEKGHWSDPYVEKVLEKNIMVKIDGEFKPDQAATREEILIGLGRIEESLGNKIEEKDIELFDDLKDKDYKNYAAWATELEIIKGYGDGTFRPENPVQREELACLIARYTIYKGVPTTKMYVGFNDSEEISEWAMGCVQTLANLGIIEGHDDGNFAPQSNITRGEIAKIFSELLELDLERE